MNMRIALLAFSIISVSACDRTRDQNAEAAEASVVVAPPAPSIVAIEMGKQAGVETLRITEMSENFRARDTVIVAVVTANAASDSRLSARWTFSDGSVVDSSGQNVARKAGSADAVTQFMVSREKGWPVGKYSVDLWLNDKLIGTKQFEVKR